jgi:hypothetical protein
MAITREEAKEICSADELEIVDASFSPLIERLTITELQEGIARARRLQDKYRDLSRRQDRGGKQAGAVPGSQNLRTRLKAQLFVETRERFEDHLAELAEEA